MCDDGNQCTEDICDAEVGCIHNPKNAWCDDGIPCTTDTCDIISGCQHTFNDASCNDHLGCTIDVCTSGGCQNYPDDAVCSDGVGCTEDTCTPSGCVNEPMNEWCDDGFGCSVDTCSKTDGCQNVYDACPWFDLPANSDVCLNCMSAGARINQLVYTDGTGAVQLQTRYNPINSNGTKFLHTNVLLTPTGQVVINGENQNTVKLHKDDGLVVNGNLRIVPIKRGDELPVCNDISRGLFAIYEEEYACGYENTCHLDVLYVCVKFQNYRWQQVSSSYFE